jgi:hypothetical protein
LPATRHLTSAFSINPKCKVRNNQRVLFRTVESELPSFKDLSVFFLPQFPRSVWFVGKATLNKTLSFCGKDYTRMGELFVFKYVKA